MDFLGGIIALLGFAGLAVGAISVFVPLHIIGITSRFAAVMIVIAGMVLTVLGSNLSPTMKASQEKAAAERTRLERVAARESARNKPSASPSGITSSGGCKTDPFGNMSCSHSAEANFGSYKGSSSSSMNCRTNPVTLVYECKTEFSSR